METKLSERSWPSVESCFCFRSTIEPKSSSRNRHLASSNLVHVNPALYRDLNPPFAARPGASRAVVRRRDQENFRHTHTDADATKEEERVRAETEVADTLAESIKEIVAGGTHEGIADAIGYPLVENFATSKEKAFAGAGAAFDASKVDVSIRNSVADPNAREIPGVIARDGKKTGGA